MITAKNLTKTYKKTSPSKIVLDDLSFTINRGERVAIVGRNGAGKTTLLRLISGSLQKTSGSLNVSGNVYPLMGIGLGVNEKFTGRENIKSSLVYNGFDLHKDIVQAIEKDIEDFTELKEFLDRPFYTYSLGMKMRLMFAIATAVKPEIFLIDEILGAGDHYFTLKSKDRLNRIITDNASTLLLVSHSTQLLKRFCDRGIWLKNGKIFLDGNINEVCSAYDAYIERLNNGERDNFQSLEDLKTQASNGEKFYTWQDTAQIVIKNFQLEDTKEGVRLSLSLASALNELSYVRILITLWGKNGDRIARIENDFNALDFRKTNILEVITVFKKSHLPQGSFEIVISIYKNSSADGKLGRVYVGSHLGIIENNRVLMEKINALPHTWSIQ